MEKKIFFVVQKNDVEGNWHDSYTPVGILRSFDTFERAKRELEWLRHLAIPVKNRIVKREFIDTPLADDGEKEETERR